MISRLAINGLQAVLCAALTTLPVQADVLVAPAVREAIQSGRARVVVELALPGGFTPVGELTEERARAQGDAIAAAQQAVLAELSGLDAQLMRRSRTTPFLALAIGPDALMRLRAMPDRVMRILPDKTAAPSPNP